MAIRAYLLLTITAISWAGNAIAGKLAAGHISPALLTSGRWLVAFVVLLPFALPHVRREWPIIAKNLPFLLVMGIVGFTIFNNLLYLALNHTSAINVTIEQASMPLVVFLANFLLFGQRISRGQILGFLMTLVGVATVASNGNLYNLLSLDVGYGDALLLLAVVFYGAYTVALRWMPKLHWLSIITTLAAAAFIGSLPFTLAESLTDNLLLPDTRGWLTLLYAAIFPSILAQVFYIMGNQLIGGNRAGLFFNLVPVFGTFFAVLLLGEHLRVFHLIALVLVIGGIMLAEHKATGRRIASNTDHPPGSQS
ncbi:MAG: DMT family transporter [Rhizobiaceae bacterium]|nr:DMT family transporter [Rhizobiaceae bacterium]